MATISRRRTDIDDDRLKAAAAYGLGFTNEAAAKFAGVSESSVKRWKDDPEIVSIVRIVADCAAVQHSRKLRESVGAVVEDAQQEMRNLFGRGLAITKRAITRAEEMGDSATLDQLLTIHKEITVWAAKFNMSEAPKRMQVEGTETKVHLHVVGFADAKNIFDAAKEIDAAIGTALIAGDANVIDITPTQ